MADDYSDNNNDKDVDNVVNKLWQLCLKKLTLLMMKVVIVNYI